MIIEDRVYGKIKIEDELILDLIKSAPVQRLKKVSQNGATVLIKPERNVTRFEHSVGVWYLLKKYGATLEEQVAGLLHDTPHTAFSHVADFVFPNTSHTFHEKFEEKVILSSDIPAILEKHGMTIEKIMNKKNFHLLEAELPDLSADRIDYFLRDSRIGPLFPDSLVTEFLNDLSVSDSDFYFKTESLALRYTILFLEAGKKYWLDPDSHGSFIILAEALKQALKIKLIDMDDLFKTDDVVLTILRGSEDKIIKKYLAELTPKTHLVYTEKSEAKYSAPNKPRIVDPYVDVGGKLVRISELHPELIKVFDNFRNKYKFIGVK